MLWSVRLSVRLSHIHHHQGCDCTAGAYCFRRRTRDLSSHKPAALTITLQRHHILTSTAVKLSNVTCIICSLVPCVCVCVCVFTLSTSMTCRWPITARFSCNAHSLNDVTSSWWRRRLTSSLTSSTRWCAARVFCQPIRHTLQQHTSTCNTNIYL